MNRILGFFSLNEQPLPQEKLAKCGFKTPHWYPDYESTYIDQNIYLSATGRFITRECYECLMPYQDQATDLVINADVYLTNRDFLCNALSVSPKLADAKLILYAYLKWGENCTSHLAGYFSFLIWNPKKQELFAAIDQFANCPLFYSYQPEECFICANEFSAFRILCPKLTIKESHFLAVAVDTYKATETSFNEVVKLSQGQQLIINKNGVKQFCYWDLKQGKLAHYNREEYYLQFRKIFEEATRACLRSPDQVMAHISGGLDSSSVAAMAAKILQNDQRILRGFTALPKDLSGPNRYKKGWYYHEMPLVQSLLDCYSNIDHCLYTAPATDDVFLMLQRLTPYLDQPLRNVTNLQWFVASYLEVLANGGRVLLTGGNGNASISWRGITIRNILSRHYNKFKARFIPQDIFSGFFKDINHNVLNSEEGKNLLKTRAVISKPHLAMLSGSLVEGLKTTAYPLQLYYGVRVLDPTQDLALTKFCYNVPQWVYAKGNAPLKRRLLVREGLKGIVPDAILQNPYRGEQAADWYLSYSIHAKAWRQQLENIHPQAKELLWRYYDQDKMLAIFKDFPTIDSPPPVAINNLICFTQMRCMSAAFYLDDFFKFVLK